MKGTDFLQRTHNCGELLPKNVGETVNLNGWVQKRRDLGGLIFIDLRDRWGLTQVVFNPQDDKVLFELAENLRSEFVVAIQGKVRKRPEGSENPRLLTGQVEVVAEKLEILSTAKTPPFVIADEINIDEAYRLKYRFLDLRRAKMFNNLFIRHKFAKAVRDYLNDLDFLEIETPMMIRSTPEGARDYLVPSRVSPGKFYALPQSPQLLKQLLMVSGMDRYFQVARCFRDEDQRADRLPEFTQIDLEMSFVRMDDILSVVENMIAYCFKEVLDKELNTPFVRMTWQQAMDSYGIDKPDTRFGMKIIDVTDIVKETSFKVLTSVIGKGGRARAIRLPGCADFSRKQADELSEFVKPMGVQGILPIALKPDKFKSPLDKHLSDGQKKELIEAMGAEEGDFIAMLAGEPRLISTVLGKLRLKMGRELKLIDYSRDDFLWITDFPMFEYNEDEDRLEPAHHAFTSPNSEDIPLLDNEPLNARSLSYDLVYNGNEAASGSIRIHERALQQKIFEIIGLSQEQAQDRFGFLLNAFEYGVPPHGGIALGFDRIIAEICGESSIREVIAFPKNSSGQCLLTGAPVEVDMDQLDILGIDLKPGKKPGGEEAKM
ncbi:MAG: aspartate--tRNA ligase [Vulcanimicrobiota bacterium]